MYDLEDITVEVSHIFGGIHDKGVAVGDLRLYYEKVLCEAGEFGISSH